jgi:hypothetical protein
VLQKARNRDNPGLDNISRELFKYGEDLIKERLHYSTIYGKLNKSQRTGK